VTYSPEVESKFVRRKLLGEQEKLLGKQQAFDGQAILFLTKSLEHERVVVKGTSPTGTEVEVTVTFTNEVTVDSPQFIQLTNIILRKVLQKSHLKPIGRNHYDPGQSVQIPKHHLELWPGFSINFNQYAAGTMLNVDVSHKILRTETVLDFMYNLRDSLARGPRGKGPDFHTKCSEELLGHIVLTRYNNRTYRVDGIAWDLNPQTKFLMKNGAEITFAKYYEEHYGKKLSDPQQPLLAVTLRRGKSDEFTLHLVPELCCMTGLADDARNDFNVMRDLATHTRVAPQKRLNDIQSFIAGLNHNEKTQQELANWNLKFGAINEVVGTRLPAEVLTFANKEVKGSVDWTNDIQTATMHGSVPLGMWFVVYPAREQSSCDILMRSLQNVCSARGLHFKAPKLVQIPSDRAQAYVDAIRSTFNPNVQLVCCIMSGLRTETYDAIKKLCCVDLKVPSQCMLSKNLQKQKIVLNIVANIAMQINCKLGGDLWHVTIPVPDLMVVGIDVYHELVNKKNSCAGFCASTNAHISKYYSRVVFQPTGQELVDQLRACMVSALRKFIEINGKPPATIIVYRDGVGDGQLDQVKLHELPQLQSAFGDIGEGYVPRLALIVVKKRISTRFFAQGSGGVSNPGAGTVVDKGCVMADNPNFFLIPQLIRQGTATPTHFNVIYDKTGLQPAHIQRLTFKLTHMYYNWPGTVRVPAPCQYAHKLAFLVGQNIQAMPSNLLADRLFFL